MNDLKSIGREVAMGEDRRAARLDFEAKRAEFIATMAERPRRRPTEIPLRMLIPAAAIACAALLLVMFRTTAETAPTPVPTADHWVRIPADESRAFAFEDGSKLELLSNTTARTSGLHLSGGVVTLEEGTARMAVRHTESTDWRILAGPFEVRVTGTRFEVSWDRDLEYFRLHLMEGSVAVSGPLLEGTQRISGPRQLTVALLEERVELARPGAPAGTPTSTTDSGTTDASKTPARDSHPERQADWLQAARQGDYPLAMERLSARELDLALKDARPADLLLLGNAGRLTGHLDISRRAYETIRSRFPTTGHAATAAFHLGRMAFDQLGNYPEAVRYLEIYLREQKSGTLTRETLGRLMEAQLKSGMKEKARGTAALYLSRYPDGPHIRRAEEIAGKQPPN